MTFKESVSTGKGKDLLSLLFPRKSYARLGDNRERTVCPRYAKYVVNTDKGAVVCKLKLGPQEMWSVLRLENVSAVSFSLVGKCYLYICKKNQQDAHFFH